MNNEGINDFLKYRRVEREDLLEKVDYLEEKVEKLRERRWKLAKSELKEMCWLVWSSKWS